MIDGINAGIEDLHDELDGLATRGFVADLGVIPRMSARNSRTSPLQVLASGLEGSQRMRFMTVYDADLGPNGNLIVTGKYARQGYIGTRRVRSLEADLRTDTISVPQRSSIDPRWVFEARSDGGSHAGLQVEPVSDGTYVLGLSQGGPTHIGARTVEHSQYRSYAYLAKLETDGALEWVAGLARPGWGPHEARMTSSADGTVYVGYELFMLGGAPVATEQNVATGEAEFDESYPNHQLLAAYSSDGTRIWQTVAENVVVRDLEAGEDGALYASGHFTEHSGLCGGIRTQGDEAAFVARFAPDGGCDWIRTTSGSVGLRGQFNRLKDLAGGINSFPALAVDGDAVYVGGSFFRRTDFGGRTFTSEDGTSTGLIARLDARTGTTQWVQSREPSHDEGALTIEIEGGYVYIADIAVDGAGHLYVVEPRREWKQGQDDAGVRLDARILKLDSRGNVLWSDTTGVATAWYDFGGYEPIGVKLIAVQNGRPYLLVQNPGFRLNGVVPPASDESVWHVMLSRLEG